MITTSTGLVVNNDTPIEKNVLNNYRSYNYVLTLASLPKDSSVEQYVREGASLDNIILKSSGKAVKGESPDFRMLANFDTDTEAAKQELDFFNKNSPGKFDFYINNFEIETLPLPTTKTGNTLPTRMRFDVFEPYSVGGFFEAIRAAALAGGFLNYTQAAFLLKMEFYGYNDRDNLPTAELIPQTTRLLKIRFTSVDVDVSLTGSIYKCTVIPFDDLAFSDLYGSLKSSMQISGNTVGDMLKNLIAGVNELNFEAARKIYPEVKNTDIDTYTITFPLADSNTDNNQENDIAKAEVRELTANNAIYQFDDIATTTRRTAYEKSETPVEVVAWEPGKFTANFAKSTNIHEIISSVIRDSKYWTSQLDQQTGKVFVGDELVNFWRIKSKIKYKGFSKFLRREAFEITYEVVVDKMHPGIFPVNQIKNYDPKLINILREYNYIYTGKNVDILDLKINFNTLFYERIPLSMGNNNKNNSQDTAQPNNSNNAQINKSALNSQVSSTTMMDRKTIAVAPTEQGLTPDKPKAAPPGGANSYTPNSILGKDYYDLLLSDSLSMIEVDLQIIGDPIWVTSAENNSIFQKSMLSFVRLYFKNPVDVDEKDLNNDGTGLFKFSRENIQFSGIYMVKTIVSTFKDAMFRQTLKLIRLPFIIDDKNFTAADVDARNIFKSVPKPGDQVIPSSGPTVVLNSAGGLKSLLSGGTNPADALQNAEARITGAIQGAVAGVATAAVQIVSEPARSISEVTNSITGKLLELDNAVVNAGSALGLTPAQLSTLSPAELLTVMTLSKAVPNNVNAAQLEKNGVLLRNAESLTQVPATGVPFIRSSI